MNPDSDVWVLPELHMSWGFSVPHLLHRELPFSRIMQRCLSRVLRPVRRSVYNHPALRPLKTRYSYRRGYSPTDISQYAKRMMWAAETETESKYSVQALITRRFCGNNHHSFIYRRTHLRGFLVRVVLDLESDHINTGCWCWIQTRRCVPRPVPVSLHTSGSVSKGSLAVGVD
jgi:hypothetical protein